MGGLYDLLETYRIQNDPRFAYEGLYQDPLREDQVDYYNKFRELKLPYGLTDAKDFQPFQSSSFPQGGYGVGSLFNPRVGRPEQSIYYNAPEPADPTSDFYQPLPGFINAPQNYYAPIQQTPSVPVQDFQFLSSAYEDDDEEQVEYLGDKPKGGIADLFRTILGFAVPGAGLFMNAGRGALEGIQSLNQRLRNTDFGRSQTLAEYFQKRRERKQADRAQEANQAVYESARRQGFTNDRGGFSTDRADDAGTSLGSGQFSPSTSRGRSGY